MATSSPEAAPDETIGSADPFLTNGNLFFQWLPGCKGNPLNYLEFPIFLVCSFYYADSFSWVLLLPMVFLAQLKIAVCMSVCLHRFFSHRGFRCSRPMVWVMYALGSLASQGPPLWWASKHRRHHRHCDTDRDPHSPVAFGRFYAWIGWVYTTEGTFGVGVDSAYVMDWVDACPELVIAENFYLVFILLQHACILHLWGTAAAVFVSMPSGLLCQMLCLAFNVSWHDETLETEGACKAVDRPLPFMPMGESFHAWHHLNPRAYHRPGADLPYHLVIRPMLALGLFRGKNVLYHKDARLLLDPKQ